MITVVHTYKMSYTKHNIVNKFVFLYVKKYRQVTV